MKGLLAKVWLVLTARCEHSSRVASDELDGPTELSDRLAARLHEAVCPGCRRVRRQLRWIDRVLRAGDQNGRIRKPTDTLSLEARERIGAALRLARDDQRDEENRLGDNF